MLLARIGSLFDQYVIDGIVDGSATLTRFASWLNGLFDNYIIDGIVNAVANVTFWMGNKFRRLQTGNINGYLLRHLDRRGARRLREGALLELIFRETVEDGKRSYLHDLYPAGRRGRGSASAQ